MKARRLRPKTGVESFGSLKHLLQKEYEKGVETGRLPAVLYVDLQHLDAVNQKFGHTVGDIVLRGIAQTVQKKVPDQDVVGRVAGDEFVVVLPATNSKRAESVAETIEGAIKQYKPDLGQKGCVDFVGCRISVVACPRRAGFAEEIISIAQKATAKSAAQVLGNPP